MLESGKYKKVVFIDDDRDLNEFYNRKLAKKLLDEYFIYFDNANDGILYLKNVKKNELPDYILLDLFMPEMDGFEFLEVLEKLNKIRDSVEIYICTTSKREADWKRAMRYPFVSAVMEKPLEIKFLEYLIKEEI